MSQNVDIEIGPDVPEAVRQSVKLMTKFTPHAQALGVRITKLERGKAHGFAPYREELIGDPDTGVIAGGVIIAFLDQLSGVAVMTMTGMAGPIATLDLRIDYMRAATPGREIRATAHCYKLTRSVAFVRAVAYEESESDPIANATAAFMLTTAPAQGDA